MRVRGKREQTFFFFCVPKKSRLEAGVVCARALPTTTSVALCVQRETAAFMGE
jgi:hypothetical protein